VDWDGVRFTISTKIKVGTFRVHALVSNTNNSLVASITSCVMRLNWDSVANKIIGLLVNFDKAMIRVLLLCDGKARSTRVEVRTIQTFITQTHNPRVTQVASGVVSLGGNVMGNISRTWTLCNSFAIAAEHIMYDDPTRFLDVNELMEGVMA
jgi:hypothetical protein